MWSWSIVGYTMIDYTVKNYYHVTTAENLMKILSSVGIDPQQAKGKIKGAWYVEYGWVSWAIAHAAQKQQTKISGLVVCKIRAQARMMHRMNADHMYFTKHVFMPIETMSAAIWLVREEKKLLDNERMISGKDWYEHLK